MAHLPKNHPVRVLLESATNGSKLTQSSLDMLDNADLPTNEGLGQYRAAVDSAARDIARIGATGNHHAALQEAERHWSALADRMTADQTAVDSTLGANEPSLSDIAARMFNH